MMGDKIRRLMQEDPYGSEPQWMPWEQARETPVSIPLRRPVGGMDYGKEGMYDAVGLAPTAQGRKDYIELDRRFSNDPERLSHEKMHAAFTKDFDKMDTADWDRIHYALVKAYGKNAIEPWFTMKEKPRETVAYMFYNYLNDPERLRRMYPEVYNYFLKKSAGKIHGELGK